MTESMSAAEGYLEVLNDQAIPAGRLKSCWWKTIRVTSG
jgi:hypothetical protein